MSNQDRPLLKYWDRLCALQPYSFFLSSPPGVKRVPDKTGNWIERHRAQEIVDSAEAEISELRSALNAMLTHMGMDEDEWNKPTFDQARTALEAAPAQEELAAMRVVGEPVAWMRDWDVYDPTNSGPEFSHTKKKRSKGWVPLYTAPQHMNRTAAIKQGEKK